MTVHPSRHQQCLLVVLFLLLLWPVAGLIAGWQWALLLPVWLAALWLSWRSLAAPPFELGWDGQWLQWQGRRYQLDKKSRILPGVLRLALCPEPEGSESASPRQLWLFSDALSPEHYRLLARAIHFLPSRR
ncbi:protein YgfX [Aeromonas veronii]|uniref:protein YgfX n=1 Tax=Aeromonas veronii TaxID=654 RepID=UPI00301DD226